MMYEGLQNPNDVVSIDGTLYVIDSYYKSRKPENARSFKPERNGTLFSVVNGKQTVMANKLGVSHREVAMCMLHSYTVMSLQIHCTCLFSITLEH